MLIIENRIIEKEEKSVRYTLNYPIIKLLNKENNFINFINKKIYEDVLCFKEVVQQILSEDESNILIDFNLEKEIKLKDIFDKVIDYKKFLTDTIKLQLSRKLECCEKEIEDELINFIYSIEIYEDQPFYLESDGLVICFSSYEMGNSITNILEFKVM